MYDNPHLRGRYKLSVPVAFHRPQAGGVSYSGRAVLYACHDANVGFILKTITLCYMLIDNLLADLTSYFQKEASPGTVKRLFECINSVGVYCNASENIVTLFLRLGLVKNGICRALLR
jgi:hypothetical protein